VIFQFFISIALIIGTLVIYTQLQFIHNKDVGFDRDQVLVIKNTDPLGSRTKAFKEEILKLSGVINATVTGFLPTNGWRTDTPLFPDATLNQKSAVSMQVWDVDENYIPTLGMKMEEGRSFSNQFPTDSNGVILNQAAVKLLGLKDPLNKTLYYIKDVNDFLDNKKDVTTCHIVGVVNDFNFNSLRDEVSPVALFFKKQNSSIAFKISSRDISGLVRQINNKWKEMAPGQPFTYSFMDEDFNNLYKNDQKVGRIFISFALFAIVIACLGLFGLVTYAAQQRTKEIGIRKVLGASEMNITSMLSKDFLKLIFVAALIAFPVAWWAMNQWLNQFAYRISISWWIFLVAGLTALLIGMITISFQAIKAAIANPVESLRSE
jgi:putative ABC transport system permease protein